MCAGKSGLVRLPSWADEYPAQVAGMVNFDPKANGLKGKTVSRNGRYTHFALVAAKQAIADAALDTKAVDASRFGCIIGSGIGGVEWFENNCNAFTAGGGGYNSLRNVQPFLIPALISNTASVSVLSVRHPLTQPGHGRHRARRQGPQLLRHHCLRIRHALDWRGSEAHARRRGRRHARGGLRGGAHSAVLRRLLPAHRDGDQVQRQARGRI